MEKKSCLLVNLLIPIMIVSFATMMGCNSTDTTGFSKFTVTEGLSHFSFEYPAFYRTPYVDRALEPNSTEVKTGGVIQPGVRGIESLHIEIFQVSDSFPDAKAMLDSSLSRSEEHQDFELLERSPITIDGVEGEQIVYSYYGFHATMESEAETGTAYKAYFDCKGLIWRIVMLVDEYAQAERAEADFDHVIETFRFLD